MSVKLIERSKTGNTTHATTAGSFAAQADNDPSPPHSRVSSDHAGCRRLCIDTLYAPADDHWESDIKMNMMKAICYAFVSSLSCGVEPVVMTTLPRAIAILVAPWRPALCARRPWLLEAGRTRIGRSAYDLAVNAWQKHIVVTRETCLRNLLQLKASAMGV